MLFYYYNHVTWFLYNAHFSNAYCINIILKRKLLLPHGFIAFITCPTPVLLTVLLVALFVSLIDIYLSRGRLTGKTMYQRIQQIGIGRWLCANCLMSVLCGQSNHFMNGCMMMACMSHKTNSEGNMFCHSCRAASSFSSFHMSFKYYFLCASIICSGFCLELDTTSLLDHLVNSGSEEDMILEEILSHECKRQLIFFVALKN